MDFTPDNIQPPSPSRTYEYITLQEASDKLTAKDPSLKYVNIHASILGLSMGDTGVSGQEYVVIQIKDETEDNAAVIVWADLASIPKIEKGDVIRLHRAKVGMRANILTFALPSLNWLVVFRFGTGITQPKTVAKSITIDKDFEKQRVEFLEDLFLYGTATPSKTLANIDFRSSKDVQVVCQVIGHRIMNPSISVLFLWDGSAADPIVRLYKVFRDDHEHDVALDQELDNKSQGNQFHIWMYDASSKNVVGLTPGDFVEIKGLRLFVRRSDMSYYYKLQDKPLVLQSDDPRITEVKKRIRMMLARKELVPDKNPQPTSSQQSATSVPVHPNQQQQLNPQPSSGPQQPTGPSQPNQQQSKVPSPTKSQSTTGQTNNATETANPGNKQSFGPKLQPTTRKGPNEQNIPPRTDAQKKAASSGPQRSSPRAVLVPNKIQLLHPVLYRGPEVRPAKSSLENLQNVVPTSSPRLSTRSAPVPVSKSPQRLQPNTLLENLPPTSRLSRSRLQTPTRSITKPPTVPKSPPLLGPLPENVQRLTRSGFRNQQNAAQGSPNPEATRPGSPVVPVIRPNSGSADSSPKPVPIASGIYAECFEGPGGSPVRPQKQPATEPLAHQDSPKRFKASDTRPELNQGSTSSLTILKPVNNVVELRTEEQNLTSDIAPRAAVNSDSPQNITLAQHPQLKSILQVPSSLGSTCMLKKKVRIDAPVIEKNSDVPTQFQIVAHRCLASRKPTSRTKQSARDVPVTSESATSVEGDKEGAAKTVSATQTATVTSESGTNLSARSVPVTTDLGTSMQRDKRKLEKVAARASELQASKRKIQEVPTSPLPIAKRTKQEIIDSAVNGYRKPTGNKKGIILDVITISDSESSPEKGRSPQTGRPKTHFHTVPAVEPVQQSRTISATKTGPPTVEPVQQSRKAISVTKTVDPPVQAVETTRKTKHALKGVCRGSPTMVPNPTRETFKENLSRWYNAPPTVVRAKQLTFQIGNSFQNDMIRLHCSVCKALYQVDFLYPEHADWSHRTGILAVEFVPKRFCPKCVKKGEVPNPYRDKRQLQHVFDIKFQAVLEDDRALRFALWDEAASLFFGMLPCQFFWEWDGNLKILETLVSYEPELRDRLPPDIAQLLGKGVQRSICISYKQSYRSDISNLKDVITMKLI